MLHIPRHLRDPPVLTRLVGRLGELGVDRCHVLAFGHQQTREILFGEVAALWRVGEDPAELVHRLFNHHGYPAPNTPLVRQGIPEAVGSLRSTNNTPSYPPELG